VTIKAYDPIDENPSQASLPVRFTQMARAVNKLLRGLLVTLTVGDMVKANPDQLDGTGGSQTVTPR
jgi:hypothetical protein